MRVFKDDILLLQREWMFLFNYLLIYPDVIKECVADFHKASHFTKLKLQTHKVGRVLLSLSPPKEVMFLVISVCFFVSRITYKVMNRLA